jgi:dipeptidyl-peptidase-4
VIVIVALLVLILPWFGAAEELTLEKIFSRQGIEGSPPSEIQKRPDGKFVTYLLPRADDPDLRDLGRIETAGGKKSILVKAEEMSKLAPTTDRATPDERERERRQRYSVAGYRWCSDSQTILFSGSGSLFLYDTLRGSMRALAPEITDADDAKCSPDARWVSFVSRNDLWIAPTSAGKPRRLTFGASETILHGALDWVYQEEFQARSGYFWSPDSLKIAFIEMDENRVPTYPIPSLLGPSPGLDLQRYPRAGDPNPTVRVGVVRVDSKRKRPRPKWLPLTAEYFPRFSWADGERLSVQTLDRAQQNLELGLFDVERNRYYPILSEQDENWINIHDDLRFLAEGKEFLWTSERSGFRHIYHYGVDGALRSQLTDGDWQVGAVVDFVASESGNEGWIYFTSNESNPLGADLFRVPLSGGDRQKLTDGQGTHAPGPIPAPGVYVDTYSSVDTPRAVSLVDSSSGRTNSIYTPPDLSEFALRKPEISELATPDGQSIRVQILKPSDFDPAKKYPLIAYVYGGPAAPTIRDAWMSRGRGLFHHYLATQGFVVAQIDDRASSVLGHKHESALAKDYGPTALRDQLTAIEFLKQKPFIDPDRIGIWGWSGGGSSTCFALTHSEVFKAGVAVAPVTDWHLYDSIYTERYMGLPDENAEAYKRTSIIEAAANLSGRLLLVHGTSDDNVHIENTYRFIDALTAAGKPYDLQIYPGKTHSIRGHDARLHLYRAIERYFKDHL